MPYSINKTNGDLLVTIEDGTADLTSTSLALVGRNYAGWGEYFNENYVKLLENFARNSQPSSPMVGQLWYDTANKLLKIYDGTEFASTGGGVMLEETSIGLHYFTFVDSDTGLPQTKVAKQRGLTFQPSSRNFGINKISAATSRLEINASSNAERTLNPPVAGGDTIVHLHGEVGKNARLLLDTYGGVAGTTSTLTLRRSPPPGSIAPQPNGSVMGAVSASGWNGDTHVEKAKIVFTGTQTWTTSANGCRIEFYATENFSTNMILKAVMHDNGDLEAKGDLIGFGLSDQRLKTNINRIPDALDKVLHLDGITFNWTDQAQGKSTAVAEAGLLAQQVKSVLPEAVGQRQDGYLGVRYDKIVSLLVEAIKDLKNEVDALKNARTA